MSYEYDKAGRLSKKELPNGVTTSYSYNRMGRIEQILHEGEGLSEAYSYTYEIAAAAPVPEKPEESIRYILDLTRSYHNMLCLETENRNNTFYWDKNTAIIEDNETEFYYLQDDLGSPMRLLDGKGEDREIYGFDEFGIALRQNTAQIESGISKHLQPFGFTGYQMEEAGGLYFAQARRYDAGLGRFVSEDFIKGSVAVPLTLNPYGYCWNRPLDLVDLNGLWPSWDEVKGAVRGYYDEHETGVKVVTTALLVSAAAALAVVALSPVGIAATVIVVAGVAVGAAIGGVTGGIANKASGSGSFSNGFVGGAGNSAFSVALSKPLTPYGANAVGGFIGSTVTDVFNNLDKPEEERKNFFEILDSAETAAKTQGLVGGSLNSLWIGTDGLDLVSAKGVDWLTTAFWQIDVERTYVVTFSIIISTLTDYLRHEFIEKKILLMVIFPRNRREAL